jgi:NTP pyrophosphatase (non-canonical NTP hydrolase)
MILLHHFQSDVKQWVAACMGIEIFRDRRERTFRFTEESLELAQACGASKADVLRLVDYVFDRPIGEIHQEIGGTMITLAALCGAHDESMNDCAKDELRRCWQNIERIRAKHFSKPIRSDSPLPGFVS